MTRGLGINPKIKYEWTQQPNGKYTIFDIPLFAATKMGDIVFTQKELEQFVENFQKDVQRSIYPRVHLGHHKKGGVENKPSIGYISYMELQNNIIYGDISDIDKDNFNNIYNKKYPYQSVEILPPFDRINSLALLESRKNYFDFPIIALEDEPTQLRFQRGLTLPEEIKETQENLQEEETQEEEVQEETVPVWVEEIKDILKNILSLLTPPEQEQEQEQKQDEVQEPLAAQKELEEIKNEIKLNRRFSELERKGLLSNNIEEKALQFAKTSIDNALLYLSEVENLLSLQRDKNKEVFNLPETLSDFADNETAMLAFQNWRDTMKHGSEREKQMLKRLAPDEKSYVEKMVELDKFSPGIYKKMIGG